MAKNRRDILFDLISSLSKSEKRHFSIYAKKINQSGGVLFLKMFNYMERQSYFDTDEMLANIDNITKSQIPNLKRSLYNHILASLSLLYDQKKPSLKIRSFINYAELLYVRGLYLQALKILHRAKKIASKNYEHSLFLQIVNLEQKIESRHITRSTNERMRELGEEAEMGLAVNISVSKLSSLKLYLQRQFIIHGAILNEKTKQQLSTTFCAQISTYNLEKLTLIEKVYFFQAHYWNAYLIQDFASCLKYTLLWTELYENNPSLKDKDFDFYLISQHHLANAIFLTKDKALAKDRHLFFDELSRKDLPSMHSFILANLFNFQAQCNYFFITENYDAGLLLIPKMNAFLDKYEKDIDDYKLMIMHYKIACLFLGSRSYDKAIDHLNYIVNTSNPLRDEIVAYAKILLITTYVEIQEETLATYTLERAKRLVSNSKQSNVLMERILAYFSQLLRTQLLERSSVFEEFSKEIKVLKESNQYKRSFSFLDLSKWLALKTKKAYK